MRDLHMKKAKGPAKNRLKKPKREPINLRPLLKKGIRVSGSLLVAVLGVLVVYEGYGVVARTTFFRVERIDVSPLKRLTRDEVLALAGVKPGEGMLQLNLQRIGEQLAKNPWVASVLVRRYFPHNLDIQITEREPVAIVNMGVLYYLDSKGQVFKPLMSGDRLDYPVITGVSEDDLAKDPDGAKQAFTGALSVMGLLNGSTVPKLGDVSEIHYDKGFGYTLFLAQGGVPIRLGNDGFADKLARLGRIYGDLQAQMGHVQYIDLDYNDKIIVKKA